MSFTNSLKYLFMLVLVLGASVAASAQRQYRVGEIKVGDHVEMGEPGASTWKKCTITAIKPMYSDPRTVDNFTLKCEPYNSTYQAIGDTDHVRPSAAGSETYTPPATQLPSNAQGSAPKGRAVIVSGGPSEKDVMNTILRWQKRSAHQQDSDSQTGIEWESAIRESSGSSQYVKNVGTVTVYPVKVDFTVVTEHPARFDVTHWSEGSYGFYVNAEGVWDFLFLSQPNHVWDPKLSIYK